ncbi:MAG: hypothetical protein Q8N55_02040 [bacterium]|nr:hypothetical protein [bacterium]
MGGKIELVEECCDSYVLKVYKTSNKTPTLLHHISYLGREKQEALKEARSIAKQMSKSFHAKLEENLD